MRAIVQSMYGSADVLEFVDIDRPVIGDSDVLVRVLVASVNSSGESGWFAMRDASSLRRDAQR